MSLFIEYELLARYKFLFKSIWIYVLFSLIYKLDWWGKCDVIVLFLIDKLQNTDQDWSVNIICIITVQHQDVRKVKIHSWEL